MDAMVNFPLHIFRAYDIRGKLTVFTPQVVTAIAYALAQQYQTVGQTKVVIGYDARLSSPQYAAILATIFEKQGLDVIDLGCCSSPMMYFMARQTHGNGVMVTASHNPKSDNGIKWILKGEPPTPAQIEEIGNASAHHYIKVMDTPRIRGLSHQIKTDCCLSYQQGLLQDIQLARPFKIVLDGLHGSAGRCAEIVLTKLGCNVIALRCEANGEFPDHAPDPSQAIHLEQLRQNIIKHKADIGIALDGDGDRLVIVDDQAHIITADRLISLFAKICLAEHPQAEIVFDVKCSSMVAQTVKALGGVPTMIRTGSSFLRSYLSQSQGKAVFGGEYAGHYVFNDGRGFGYDDGLYAALRVLEYLSQFPEQTLSQLLSTVPERYCTEDTYISTYRSEPKIVLQDIERLSYQSKAHLSKIDGIRLDFADGFGIIRASNTGEYFTVRFDAANPLQLAHIRHQFVRMLQDKYPKIAQDISNIH
ncbi:MULTISPECIES: phosphomannomutase/phosphoglucomutase [unclassified Acinetobacter]|uniref:phosphomannomutase/phosphoglucomutase n=1 Tax=unclassified Acinetobacter TaxID=196816 RepID=UPI00190DB95C|nr:MULTISPECIES: phosphomannomutase/phosphoglucomutase [unclassified Acinetobacter]MBK0064978.1 phosphomannomutase/phosphoglucomutase [Acinetobacter sp. S55]MBK0067331.1 phosphomannomutase/phosphoglucomutase [Acinetobacter sp. S54]